MTTLSKAVREYKTHEIVFLGQKQSQVSTKKETG